ncbi:unnamed protein product [Cuscuta campestris]|uniref:Uncharacterized protein n=1 Tax=Cuscuta campestris TaxID=132261 RepID=A0A484KUZ6_9ASTE|nr:unnamed protein product [Cuscuta campestris]
MGPGHPREPNRSSRRDVRCCSDTQEDQTDHLQEMLDAAPTEIWEHEKEAGEVKKYLEQMTEENNKLKWVTGHFEEEKNLYSKKIEQLKDALAQKEEEMRELKADS